MSVDFDRSKFQQAVDKYYGLSQSFMLRAKYQDVPPPVDTDPEIIPLSKEEGALLVTSLIADRQIRLRQNPDHPNFDHGTRRDRSQIVKMDAPGGKHPIALRYRQSFLTNGQQIGNRHHDQVEND